MLRTQISSTIIALSAALAVSPAHATPLAYNEAVSGDLPENAPFPVLPLDVGVNTVTGTSFVNFPPGGPNSADFDSFEFSVPANTQLLGITYTSTVTNDTSGDTTLRMEAFVDDVPVTKSFACQEFYIINKNLNRPNLPGSTGQHVRGGVTVGCWYPISFLKDSFRLQISEKRIGTILGR